MSTKQFDPNKFIDREFEQELFEELLQFRTSARILAIQDAGGMGKSHLLEKFQYRCRTVKPRTPVSLIALDQLSNYSPLSLVKIIVKHLSVFGINFDSFNKYEMARLSGDFNTIRSYIDLRGSIWTGARDVKNVGIEFEYAQHVSITSGVVELTPQQQEAAQEFVSRSFFDDLRGYCTERPVVLIFDSYDKCKDELKAWITDYFLEQYFFNPSDVLANLALVIAGQEIPPFAQQWPKEDCDSIVRSVSKLAKWKKKHVKECLRVHGFNYTPELLDKFYNLIKKDIPPSQVVAAIQTASNNPQSRS